MLNRPNLITIDTESTGDLDLLHAHDQQSADLGDIGLGKLGMPMPTPTLDVDPECPMSDCIVHVGPMRIPPEIREPAIERVSVVMAPLKPFGTRPTEGFEDQPMDEIGSLLSIATAQLNARIAVFVQPTLEPTPSTRPPSSVPPAPDRAVVAEEVAGKTWKRDIGNSRIEVRHDAPPRKAVVSRAGRWDATPSIRPLLYQIARLAGTRGSRGIGFRPSGYLS
jgi:hypothetical protein